MLNKLYSKEDYKEGNKREMIDDKGRDGARSSSANLPAANVDNVEGGNRNKREKHDVLNKLYTKEDYEEGKDDDGYSNESNSGEERKADGNKFVDASDKRKQNKISETPERSNSSTVLKIGGGF